MVFFYFNLDFKSIYFSFLYSCDFCRFVPRQSVSSIAIILLFNNDDSSNNSNNSSDSNSSNNN